MTSKFKKLAAVTALSLSFAGPSFAMEQELNMLTGAVFNSLTKMQMDVANMANLTLGEINIINSIMHGGDSESEKQNKISTILRNAAER
jgi:hypothetical protein